MNETLRQRIIALLSRDINRLYSISDIAKKLNVAYSHCNKFIKDLNSENVIKLIKFANAHMCTLNLNETSTRAYLVLNEYNSLRAWKLKNKQKIAKINLFLSRIKEKKISIDSLFISQTHVYILVLNVDREIIRLVEKEKLGLNYILMDRGNFWENQDQIIKEHQVVYGAEKFWEIVKKEIKIE